MRDAAFVFEGSSAVAAKFNRTIGPGKGCALVDAGWTLLQVNEIGA